MAKGTVVVKFLGDANQFNRTLGGVEGRLGRMGGTFSRVGRMAGAALGGAVVAGVGAAGYALFEGAKNASALQQILGQTNAVLKSTGGAAGVTAKQVRDLANQINNYSTLDDDAVQSGENLLLTFTNIQNKVGKGNDIFNRATKTMADMSTALGQDTKSSAIQLGKALNDPIKGVTALQRVGVSFTTQQKTQIAALVSSGHTLKAQKLILHELNKEFGGSAKAAGKTFAGAIFHLKDTLSDLLRDAILPLLPSLTKFAEYLSKTLPGAMQSAITWVKETVSSLGSGGGGLSGVFATMKGVLGTLIDVIGGFVRSTGPPLLSFFQTLGSFVATNILPVLRGLGDFIAHTLAPAIGGILGAAVDGLKSAFGSISSAIQNHREQLGNILNAVKGLAKFYVGVIAPILKTVLPVAFKILGKAIAIAIDILAQLGDILGGIKVAAKAVADFFTGPFIHAIGQMVSVFIRAVKFMADAALSAFGVIVHAGSTMLGWVPGIGGKLKGAARAFDAFKAQVDSTLAGLASDAAKWGTKAGSGFSSGFNRAINLNTDIGGGGGGPHGGGFVNGGAGGHDPSRTAPTGTGTGSSRHHNITVHVYNPVPEKASDSVPKQLAAASYVHNGMAWA